MQQVSIRKVGHREYRAAPRGSGLVYEIREGGWTSGKPGERIYSIDRVEQDGTRTAIAGPYVYSDVPSTLRECEHRIWMDLPDVVKYAADPVRESDAELAQRVSAELARWL